MNIGNLAGPGWWIPGAGVVISIPLSRRPGLTGDGDVDFEHGAPNRGDSRRRRALRSTWWKRARRKAGLET